MIDRITVCEAVRKSLNWLEGNKVEIETSLLFFTDEVFFRHMYINGYKDKFGLVNLSCDSWEDEIYNMLKKTEALEFPLKLASNDILTRMQNCNMFDIFLGLTFLRGEYGFNNCDYINKLNILIKNSYDELFGFLYLFDFTFNYFLGKIGLQKVPYLPGKYEEVWAKTPQKIKEIIEAYQDTHIILIHSNFMKNKVEKNKECNDAVQNILNKIDWAINLDYGDLVAEFMVCLSLCNIHERKLLERMGGYLLKRQKTDGGWCFPGYSTKENRHSTYMATIALTEWITMF